MNKRTLKTAIMMAATLSSSALVGDPVITIQPRAKEETPPIIVRSQYDFDRQISLKVKTSPAFDVSDALIKTVSQLALYDDNGVRITSGFDIDPLNNLVVAFSGGTSEIIRVAQGPDALSIIASFKDSNGNFISPPKDSLALYNLHGEKLCFTYEGVTQSSETMYFALLLDRSWSMKEDIDAVKNTAKSFLGALPQNAMCAVANFGDDWSYSHNNYQPCRDTDFGIDDIALSGTTDIYPLLNVTYQNFARSAFDDAQKTVIIISDGLTLDDPARRQELIALKNDVLSFTYFIGDVTSRNALEGITDHFITHKGDVRASLGEYFTSLNTAYATQKVLRITPCARGSHVK